MKSLSSADANRHFSAVLRDVSKGEEIVVVSRGKPVARIIGVQADAKLRTAAKAALLKRLLGQPATGIRKWKRADLYE